MTHVSPGLLVVGGSYSLSVEWWSPDAAAPGCSLPPLPSYTGGGHTLDMVAGTLLSCYNLTCLNLNLTLGQDNSIVGWQEAVELNKTRKDHSSMVTSDGLFLLGGWEAPSSTELLSITEEPEEEVEVEGWALETGRKDHCSIQLDPTTIVLTGGFGTFDLTTLHLLTDTGLLDFTLPSLIMGRRKHACGAYSVDRDGTQVQYILLNSYKLNVFISWGCCWWLVAGLSSLTTWRARR